MFMVPTKIIPTALSPLFSWPTKFRMLGELLSPPRRAEGDESVAAMVRRHFGDEVVDRLAGPLLSGVYGGDADSLSVRAVLPRFVEMEEKCGSLCRAMLLARKKQAELRRARGGVTAPLFSSLKGGMQQLIDAIVTRLDAASVRTECGARELRRLEKEWEVVSERGVERFDAVIFATPARVAAPMLAAVDRQLSEDLGRVEYSSSITMTLGFRREDLKGCKPGFGFLVPRSAGTKMMAATYVHTKFPFRTPEDKALVRCFFGSVGGLDPLAMTDGEAVETVRRELGQITGLKAEPQFIKLYRWDRSMAQYTPGHLERLARMEKTLDEIGSLALAGNFWKGIGVPDCVRTGREAARKMVNATIVSLMKK